MLRRGVPAAARCLCLCACADASSTAANAAAADVLHLQQLPAAVHSLGAAAAAPHAAWWPRAAGQRCGVHSSTSSTSNQQHQQQQQHDQDQIILQGMVFHGYHGALPEENVLGQKFIVDATLTTSGASLAAAGRSDRLADTIDYAAVYGLVHSVVTGPPRALQEAVAETLCERLLEFDARVAAVSVYIRKPHVALPGVLESVGVRITRHRSQHQQQQQA